MDQVNTLRGELNWYSRTIQLQEGRAANLMAPQLVKLRRAARDCEQRLVESLASLRVEDAEYSNLQTAGSVPIETIRAALPEGALLLEYYCVGDTFHACLLSRDSLKIVPVGSAPELRRELQLLRFQLSKFRLGPDYVKLFDHQLLDATNAHLHEFHEQLIAPLADDLKAASHLIIAPHDFLHYLPFHALLDDGGRTLGDRFTISYTPSASVYYLCSTKPAARPAGSLVLGIPDPAAPQIEDEVRAVARRAAGQRGLPGGRRHRAGAAGTRARTAVSCTSRPTGGSARTTRCSARSAWEIRSSTFSIFTS